ncbi:MAG: PilZ domain-containing protein [Opitutae bacterium]|nr:PilZ domain-containing protein [Opitutae bacterium]
MLFFKRILKQPAPTPSAPAVERRSKVRYAVSPAFALKAVLSFIARDDTGAPMSDTRQGWNWKGRLIDCSEEGVRIQMGPGLKIGLGDPCDLKLAVDDYALTLPCHVINVTGQPEGTLFGLQLDPVEASLERAYRQLLEVIALGSTLKLQPKAAKPDASGYLVEVYASDRASRLTVWRHPADESLAAFEFQLKDNLVRGVVGQSVEFLSDLDGTGSRPASTEKCLEIGRLFTWVVPNLAAAVPDDVRSYLKHCAF